MNTSRFLLFVFILNLMSTAHIGLGLLADAILGLRGEGGVWPVLVVPTALELA